MKITNPATDELIGEVNEDDKEQLHEKFNLLKQGQNEWRNKSISQRVEVIRNFSRLLSEKKQQFGRDLTLEMGKPIKESIGEIEGALYRINYFLENTENYLEAKLVNEDGTTKEVLSYAPLGVVGNISAWNYPYLVGVNVIIPALLAGNGVLYKPSEYTTLTGQNITNALSEAGVLENAFKLVIGEAEIGKEILKLPLDGHFFTGSHAVGKYIAEQVSPHMVPVGLELGGKDPVYVMEDIKDVSQVAKSLVEGCFYNNGQSCCAVERLYVHHKVFDEFVSNFVKVVKNLKMGDPTQADTELGPLARAPQCDFLLGQIRDAVEKGAKVLTGGEKKDGPGNFFYPTVLVDVDHTMSVMKDETFGPVVGIQKCEDDEQARQLMADTRFGLTAGVFSQSKERAMAILDSLEVGNAYWNCCDRVSPYLPWAGQKQSGLGQTLSMHGIFAFTRPVGLHLRTPQ